MKYDILGLKEFVRELHRRMITEGIKQVQVDLIDLKNKFAPNSTPRLNSFKQYIRKVLKDIIYMQSLNLEVKVIGNKVKFFRR